MCKLIEQRINEEKIESIKRMLDSKKLSHTEIANFLNVSIKLVEEIANDNVA